MGEIENASGVGTVGNAKCGDIMRMYLDIDEIRLSGTASSRLSAVALRLLQAVWLLNLLKARQYMRHFR